MKSIMIALSLSTILTLRASAFCGFYVAKADTKLFNQASKVVIVRDGDKTVLTMANDYQGELKEFAVVIPVPTFLEREQIHVTENKVIDHLDAYSAPRLVEYFDRDPCNPPPPPRVALNFARGAIQKSAAPVERAKSLGVTIEAEYTVGEYDILILSAKESDGLETWLRENDYKIPEGATEVLGSYIKQKMRFFVARVNLEQQSKLGFSTLRPLQVAYESPKFMLPIRLGTINAKDYQELFAFVLTKKGRVETTNYKTVKLPSNLEVPVFVKNDFADFYTGMFDHQVKQHGMKNVYLEYAWDMAWCDPCAADPLSRDELRELGVFWMAEKPANPTLRRRPGGAQNVFVTRLHVRYTAETFPEDLQFQQTSDRQNFQGRYILQHPWTKGGDCGEKLAAYEKNLVERMEKRVDNLASITGWEKQEIRDRMDWPVAAKAAKGEGSPGGEKWYKKLWKK